MKKLFSLLVLVLLFAPAMQAQVSTEGETKKDSSRVFQAPPPDTMKIELVPGGNGGAVMQPTGATKKAGADYSGNKGLLVDRIIGVVGNQIVKESDMENAIDQYRNAGFAVSDSLRGSVFDQLMFKKLLIQQAKHDSITVTDAEITGETDRRMRYFLMQFRSDDEFEKFYGKSIESFKFELHDQVRELLLAQRMQQTITQNVSVSPADVTKWFNAQPPDSLPFINSQVEIGQIVIIPPPNAEIEAYVVQTLEDIRQRILTGKLTFCDAALTYSKDPGSFRNCGIYENIRRGTFVPEFDAVCFTLKEGEISMPFKTEYGYHIVKLISRRGEEVTIQHILMDVPAAPEDLKKCKARLDSVLYLIKIDSLNFCEAAAKYSEDVETKFSCGLFVNPETGTTRIDVDQLGQYDADPQFPITINNMKVGQVSAPQPCLTRNGKQAYRILYLKSRSQPHRANLKDDYQLIQDLTLEEKQNQAIDAWVRKRLMTTYVRIAPDYKGYHYKYPWLQYNQ